METNYYLIEFHDSRIRTASVPFSEGELVKEMVREAVLARLAQMSGPLTDVDKTA